MTQTIGGAVLAGLVLLAAGRTAAGVVTLGLAVVVLVLVSRAKAAVAGRGTRAMRIHTHGGHGTKTAARHEAGHLLMTRKLGYCTGAARIFPDGSGVTEVHLPADAPPEHDVAISIAGRVAARTAAGCGGSWWPERESDNWYIEQALQRVPRADRARVLREGKRLAEHAVGGVIRDGGVAATAKRLHRDGEIR